MLNCNHITNDYKKVCIHLLQDPENDHCQWFSGKGLEYHLICLACRKKDSKKNIEMEKICKACFAKIEEESYWERDKEGILGTPEIFTENSSLFFTHKIIEKISFPLKKILAIVPSPIDHTWYVILSSRKFYQINFTENLYKKLPKIPRFSEKLLDPILKISPDGKWAALANRKGQYGISWEISTGKKSLKMDRGKYKTEHGEYSFAFLQQQQKTYIIHASSWNRLDISDIQTGELITNREYALCPKGERPKHYLDYFHCSLAVSPNQQWIVDNGWVWHPCGMVVSWNIQNWLKENKWESEDGPSRKILCDRDYYWDGPLCWVNDTMVAIWGYGNDDYNLLPAILLFDVCSGECKKWFAGPQKGNVYFNKYLFSCSSEGTTVWDVEKGTLLHEEKKLVPISYHPFSNYFLSISLKENIVTISNL